MIDKDTIIKLARNSGAGVGTSGRWLVTQAELESFAQSIYRQGLEAAAKKAEEWPTDWAHSLDVAAAIRKLEEQP